MRPELDVAEVIINRFKAKGYAQGPRNKFGFVKDDGNKIIVSRESGKDALFKREDLAEAVAAIRKESSIYHDGRARTVHNEENTVPTLGSLISPLRECRSLSLFPSLQLDSDMAGNRVSGLALTAVTKYWVGRTR